MVRAPFTVVIGALYYIRSFKRSFSAPAARVPDRPTTCAGRRWRACWRRRDLGGVVTFVEAGMELGGSWVEFMYSWVN